MIKKELPKIFGSIPFLRIEPGAAGNLVPFFHPSVLCESEDGILTT
jgi:hypothetical protein